MPRTYKTKMSKLKKVKTSPIYYHDCPALGPHTKVVRATLLNKDNTIVLGYQHKCPFCSATAGEFEPAPGVKLLPDGTYAVDVTKAGRV